MSKKLRKFMSIPLLNSIFFKKTILRNKRFEIFLKTKRILKKRTTYHKKIVKKFDVRKIKFEFLKLFKVHLK